ncbi:MAG TPA: GH1 family beta-glucosidase [Polyangiaceae bacterium]|jgi:beta-glucosidase|nr:GH1 family beta-glucosidase [Polyangiaceae bacterium]
MPFPKDFTWGAAAASYQIEGAANEDGKGPSVWDMFCKTPGKVFRGHTGDVACDHYHRYAEDVALMKEIGLQAYRLSISWPRVLPQGIGQKNEAGLAFYDRLTDALLAAGVEPYVTLFHWDYPLALYHRGGWLNSDAPNWFADYTALVVDRLSDRVKNWITFNEPAVFIGTGHFHGYHAPGDKLRLAEVTRAAHHVLLSHGKSTQVIRARTKQPCRVGYAPNATVRIPHTDSAADIAAAKHAMFESFDREDIGQNGVWVDPVYLGHYPQGLLDAWGSEAPVVKAGDLETIHQPLDFFGTNIYACDRVKAKASGEPGAETLQYPPGHPLTGINWPLSPDSLYWGARLFTERYQKPIYITENGLSMRDWVSLDGKVHDPGRIDFLTRYLSALRRAVDHGANVAGYFQWSILDNFEWAEGYRERFGLIHVDYQTQKRTLKDSAHFYSEIIRANGGNLPELPLTEI